MSKTAIDRMREESADMKARIERANKYVDEGQFSADAPDEPTREQRIILRKKHAMEDYVNANDEHILYMEHEGKTESEVFRG